MTSKIETTFKTVNKYGVNDKKEILAHDSHQVNMVGRMAHVLIEKWGMVAGIPDGEDSAGRSALRLMTPDEIVGRSFETAELFEAAAFARGHMLEVPSPFVEDEEESK